MREIKVVTLRLRCYHRLVIPRESTGIKKDQESEKLGRYPNLDGSNIIQGTICISMYLEPCAG
jgi:hypothetical protein